MLTRDDSRRFAVRIGLTRDALGHFGGPRWPHPRRLTSLCCSNWPHPRRLTSLYCSIWPHPRRPKALWRSKMASPATTSGTLEVQDGLTRDDLGRVGVPTRAPARRNRPSWRGSLRPLTQIIIHSPSRKRTQMTVTKETRTNEVRYAIESGSCVDVCSGARLLLGM